MTILGLQILSAITVVGVLQRSDYAYQAVHMHGNNAWTPQNNSAVGAQL